MKQDNKLEIPVGVSLTHDNGKPVFFAYVGGKGPLGMRAKRFNPRVIGSVERALKQAIRWRKQALREHTAAVAALPARPAGKPVPRARSVRKPAVPAPRARKPVVPARGARKPAKAARKR